ncbi:MAG: clostripain-related cysteine peptidase [Vicinamibacterales bacterium]
MMSEVSRVKSWAVLAYTVADDKGGGGALDSPARRELQAMCDAADFEHVSMAAQVDFKHSRGAFRGVITDALRRLHDDVDDHDDDVNRYPLWKSIVEQLRSSRLSLDVERRELNAASSRVLQAFLRFGHRECPAHRHMLYFYGHGYGPMGLFFDSSSRSRVAHTLRLNDLADSLEAAEHKATVVLFRDCYMSTVETAYQLKDVADFMIATQAEAPIAGVWPWKHFLQELKPSHDSEVVAHAIVKHLGTFLDSPENRGILADVPVTLLDLRTADELVPPLADLVDALDAARGDESCAEALEAARIGNPNTPTVQPGDPALLDVATMCANLKRTGQPHVERAAHALGDVVAERLVRWHHAQNDVHRGISIYYQPVTAEDIENSHIYQTDTAADDAKAYKELAINRATGWHRIALHPLAKASRRG